MAISAPPRTATALLAVLTGHAAAAESAMLAGADMLDTGDASPETAGRIRRSYPGTPLAGRAGSCDMVRDPGTARQAGTILICASLAGAAAALDAGVPRGDILVAVPPRQVPEAMAAGWAVLAEVDEALSATAGPDPAHGDHPAAVEAAAAICAWLGVPVVRTRHVARIRRALDMTASIMGTRPPAWTLRGLA